MPRPPRKALAPYDATTLERAALDYVARYATTTAKLGHYLRRKLRERGWDGDGEPPVDAMVRRFAEKGFVDDRGFAMARSEALLRRGYGVSRIRTALRAAGVETGIAQDVEEELDGQAEQSALRFARRRRIGPFAPAPPDPAEKRRWIAAMARAGHSLDLIFRILGAERADEDIDL